MTVPGQTRPIEDARGTSAVPQILLQNSIGILWGVSLEFWPGEQTVIVDDSTGTATAIPLSDKVKAALTAAGLPGLEKVLRPAII